jgi:hypothetical protein
MARGNDGTINRYIDLGDIAAARFDKDVDWTFLSFFRVNQISTDDNAIVAKWGTGTNQQFMLRTDNTPSGNAPMEVWMNATLLITGALNIVINTWYMAAVANVGSTNTLHLFLYQMDGTVLDDDLTATSQDDTDQTAPIRLGARIADQDNIDGELAHAAYIDKQMSKAEIELYLRNPEEAVVKHITDGVQFHLELGLGSPEPDFSGKGNNGTVTGAMTIEDNPPVAQGYGIEAGWRGITVSSPVLADTITILVSGVGDRGIYDTYSSTNTPDTNNSQSDSLVIGTSVSDDWDGFLEIDLTGIPKDIKIISAVLALNVTTAAAAGSAAELAAEFVRVPHGLAYDIEALTYNNYDGINPWPFTRFDYGLIVLDALPTSTGAWNVELKALINDSIRLGEKTLTIAVRRVQRIATHKSITVDSSRNAVNADRPTLTITHEPSLPPVTVIVGNRLQVVNPINYTVKPHYREGEYDLGGNDLIVSADGGEKITSDSSKINFYAGSVNSLNVSAIELDGKSVLSLTNFGGRRGTMTGGHRSAATVVNQLAETALSYTGEPGWLMHRAGSIVGLSMVIDINAISGSTITLTMFKDGVIMTGCEAVVPTPIVANGQEAKATFANGVHTFAAGEVIAAYRRAVGGTRTTDDFVVLVEVEFDN